MMFVRGLGGAGMFFRHYGFMVPGLWISIAAVALAIGIIVYLAVSAKNKRKAQSDGAADALKLRYVKGELTEEDYQKMKEVIGK
ncbi:MAG: hypothetical protein GX417_07510 [Clostridiales bacterium]|nr:hypothetical protein [Clostridiales bacterium]